MTGFFARQMRFSGLLDAAAVLVLVLAGLGFFGRTFWVLDLCAHFRLQYLAALVLLAVTFLLLRKTKRAAVCFVAAAVLTVPLIPYFIPAAVAKTSDGLKVVSFNVNTANTNYEAIRNELLAQNADILFLMEMNDPWIDQLKPLEERYPYRLIESRADNFGVAVYSRLPLQSPMISPFTDYEIPAVEFSVEKDGTVYSLTGLHTLPPISASYSSARNAQLRKIIGPSPDAHRIVIGDFNLTPFSPHFSALLTGSGLLDSALGYGLPTTWMSHHPLFAIPIDHALVSGDLQVHARELGKSLGSDHRPLILTVAPRPR